MHFSIFGVPFKCTKDMFDQDKLVWSACALWTALWRYLAVLGCFLLVGFVGFGGVVGLSHLACNSGVVFMGLVGLVMISLFVGNLLIFAAIQYYALFRKQYQSFGRSNPEYVVSVKLISWEFGRPYLINIGIMFVANIVAALLFSEAGGVLFLFALFLFHVTLHGGTWGFVPVAKQPKSEVSEVKS
ncbi:MAG: hypothetical protein Q8R43_01225 [Alphaproteobacteria bacterium]|nr:hypothetical protein [Alphaproteobacteria bacterium]